jgi:hypothetical protein
MNGRLGQVQRVRPDRPWLPAPAGGCALSGGHIRGAFAAATAPLAMKSNQTRQSNWKQDMKLATTITSISATFALPGPSITAEPLFFRPGPSPESSSTSTAWIASSPMPTGFGLSGRRRAFQLLPFSRRHSPPSTRPHRQTISPLRHQSRQPSQHLPASNLAGPRLIRVLL